MNNSRYQRWCRHLTPQKMNFLLTWELGQFCGVSVFLLFGVICLGWRLNATFHHKDGWSMIIGSGIWTALSLAALYSLPQQKLERLKRNRFFELCGDLDSLYERLQNGAETVLFESPSLVLPKPTSFSAAT